MQFIAGGTAGRLPGLVSGQIDGVSLHPENVYLAKKKKPGLHVLVQLAELMPNYYFNAYGAPTAWIEKDLPLMVDAVAAMIEANRTIYQGRAKVVPIIMKATGRPKDAVEYAWKVLTEHCVWSVNDGYDAKRIAMDHRSRRRQRLHQGTRSRPSTRSSTRHRQRGGQEAGGRVKIGKCTE